MRAGSPAAVGTKRTRGPRASSSTKSSSSVPSEKPPIARMRPGTPASIALRRVGPSPIGRRRAMVVENLPSRAEGVDVGADSTRLGRPRTSSSHHERAPAARPVRGPRATHRSAPATRRTAGFEYVTNTANWPSFWPGIVRVEPGSRWAEAGDEARIVIELLRRPVELRMTLRRFEPRRLVEYDSTQAGLPDA